jgi:hypothetical protein
VQARVSFVALVLMYQAQSLSKDSSDFVTFHAVKNLKFYQKQKMTHWQILSCSNTTTFFAERKFKPDGNSFCDLEFFLSPSIHKKDLRELAFERELDRIACHSALNN